MDIATSIEEVQEVTTSTGNDPEIIPNIATTTVDPDTTCTTVLSDIPPISSLVADPTNNNNNDTVTTGTSSIYNDPNLLPVVVDVVEPSQYQEEKGEETNTGTSMNIVPPLLPVVMEMETTHHPTTTTNSNTSTKEEDEETIMMSNIINSNSNSSSNSNSNMNEFDPHATSALQTLFREHEAMKEKVTKLKTLLGRSAKAQRDTKVEMEVWQRKYDTLYKENMKLQTRVQQLSARPTHLDLLADFETNFDRALLSVVNQNNNHNNQIQSGGQDTSGTTSTLINNNTTNIATGNTPSTLLDTTGSHNNNTTATTTSHTNHHNHNHNNSMDHILIQELSDAKKRIETLEQYNATLVQRSTQLEHQYNTMKRDTIMELQQKISHLELEKKMANMEVDHMTKQLQYNQSSLQEMQLEIELLHKQSTIQQTAAHRREVKSMEHSSSSGHGHGGHHTNNKQSQQLIQHLQEQVKALEEWAMASNHAKTIANDRIRLLEEQLLNTRNSHYSHSSMTDVSVRSSGSHHHHLPPNDHSHTNNHNNETLDPTIMNPTNDNVDDDISSNERILDTRKASIVIGAGDVGVVVFELPIELLKSINHFTQRVVLRWRFDILQGSDADITFGIWKGSCMTAAERRNPIDAIIQKRYVKGGAGGEIDEHAFSVRQSCTVVWSNQHSWVRPRTIKYILEAIVMDD